MTSAEHEHAVARVYGPYRYTHPVAARPDEENPAAHGGVHYVETCDCGHERGRLVNGRHVEVGEWAAAREPAFRPVAP